MRVVQVTGKPIYHRDSYTLAAQREVIEYFYDVLFKPILDLCENAGFNLKHQSRENAFGETALTKALKSGKVWYTNGDFSGQFSAPVSRELHQIGGKFDKSLKVFHLKQANLPMAIRNACYESKAKAEALHAEIIRTLDTIQGNVTKAPVGLNLNSTLDKVVGDLQKQFIATVSGVEGLEVAAQITPGIKKALSEKFTTNLDLYIKKFAVEEIPKLRAKVEENAFAGYRADRLAKIIETQYGVTQRKAKFLANQETSLLVSKFREERYRECGVTKYRWSTSHDERVRPDHKALNQTIQSFDLPPITNLETGARNNPGEDFNCLPGDAKINVAYGVEKCFRRRYRGELATIILETGETMRVTRNHPVLTVNGWKPAHSINQTDHVINLGKQLINPSESDEQQGIPTIAEIFDSLMCSSLSETFPGKREQFHGDGSDDNINVVRAASHLSLGLDVLKPESGDKFLFSKSNHFTWALSQFTEQFMSFLRRHIPSSFVRSFCKGLALLKGHSAHPQKISFGSSADVDPGFKQPASNNNSFKAGAFRDGQFAFARNVSINDRFWVKLKAVMPTLSASCVKSNVASFFDGHVYNLQTKLGWYATGNIVTSNCRCVAIPVLDIEIEK